ncbi:Transposase_IS4 [Hexamita inflata]|uniref:Transposase IS4 n=1 Tax=Hexamita inflata TaxID=28002 RepID=A0AA86P5P9_9EUKA|nr:Transposase IS4 [Hexamita inflata]CAI9931161.1 Transposase IS4 [Hexamita inflata]
MSRYPELALYQHIMPQQFDVLLKQITNNNLNMMFPYQQLKFLAGEWECYQAALLAIFCVQPTNFKYIWDEPDFYGIHFITEMFNYEDMLAFIKCYSPQSIANSHNPQDTLVNEHDSQDNKEEQIGDQMIKEQIVNLLQKQHVITNKEVPKEIINTTETIEQFISYISDKFLEFKDLAKNLSMNELIIPHYEREHITTKHKNLYSIEQKLLCVFDTDTGFCYSFQMEQNYNFQKLIYQFSKAKVCITAPNFFYSQDNVTYCKNHQIQFVCKMDKNITLGQSQPNLPNTWKLFLTYKYGPKHNITSYMQSNNEIINIAHTWIINPNQSTSIKVQYGDDEPDAIQFFNTHFKDDYQIQDLMDTFQKLGILNQPKMILFTLQAMILQNCQIVWNQQNPDNQQTTKQYIMNVAKQLKKQWFPVLIRNRFSNIESKVKHYQINLAFNKNMQTKQRQFCFYCKDTSTYLSCTCGIIVCAQCFHIHLMNQLNTLVKE